MSDDRAPGWEEADSALFLEWGEIFTPRRQQLASMLLSLIPATTTDAFRAVELGVGSGWLAEAVLERFPRASVQGLDGSTTMLDAARSRLAPFGGRFTAGRFELMDSAWPDALSTDFKVIFSSLTLHHLDDAEKKVLYARLRPHLASGGALVIADIIAPANELGRKALAASWDTDVRQQSREATGDDSAFQRFQSEKWNIFAYPDPDVDKPSNIQNNLTWLSEAGYTGVDAFWVRSGHAVYGGYAP